MHFRQTGELKIDLKQPYINLCQMDVLAHALSTDQNGTSVRCLKKYAASRGILVLDTAIEGLIDHEFYNNTQWRTDFFILTHDGHAWLGIKNDLITRDIKYRRKPWFCNDPTCSRHKLIRQATKRPFFHSNKDIEVGPVKVQGPLPGLLFIRDANAIQ